MPDGVARQPERSGSTRWHCLIKQQTFWRAKFDLLRLYVAPAS
jgi:hypothetical protein